MKTKLILLLVVLMLTTWANAQNSTLMKYLPAGVNTVISFSPLKLTSKIPGEAFRQSAMYREMMKNDKGEIRAFLSDPSVSGVDLSADMLVLITNDTASSYPGAIVSVMGLLKNEALFSLMVNKLKGEDDSLKIYGTNRMLLAESSKPAIAWNDEIFVITNGRTAEMRARIMASFSDTTDMRPFEEKMKEFTEIMIKSKRDHCFELLTPKTGNRAGMNDHFKEVMSSAGDIKIWSNGGGISQGILKRLPPQVLSMLSQLKPVTGIDKTTIINFENGKISSVTKAYPGKEITAAYEKYPAGQLNTNLLQRLPAESKLLGVMAFTANPDLSKELMKQSGINEILDSLKEKIPFDPRLLTASFGSECLIALLQMPVKEKAIAEDNERPRRMFDGLDFVLAMPIRDKAKFEQLRTAITHQLDSMKGTEAGEKYLGGKLPVIKYNDNLFVIAMQEETAANFLNNTGITPVPAWVSQHITNPMIGMLDFREMINLTLRMTQRDDTEESEEAEMKKMVSIFDKIVFTGGVYSNGSLSSNTDMYFGKPDENAMKQLFDFLNMAIEQSEKKKRRYENEMPPPQEGIKEFVVPDPDSKDAPKIVSDTEVKVEIREIKQEEEKTPPPPPPPPPPPVKKKTTTVKKKN